MKRNEPEIDSDSGGEGSSSGIRKKQKYGQQFKEEWQSIPQFKGWLTKSSKGKSYAKCKACNKDIIITSGKDALFKHSLAKYHEKASKSIAKQPLIVSFVGEGLSSKTKLEENVKEGNCSIDLIACQYIYLYRS